jgi:F1F0 ATPase subunit 2
MSMIEGTYLLFALVAGIALGALFFGGLWWTIQTKIVSSYAALWLIGSMFLRTSLVLVGFYFVGHSRWDRLLVCLMGFITARFWVLHLTKKAGA